MFVVNIINYFFFFDKAGCTRCFFSKTHQSSLNLKFFLKSTRLLFLIKRAALGNLKVNFHCAHLHRFFPLKKGLSKTHQSSLTLKGGSTAFPKPLSPQGTGDVPTALLGAQTATL